MTTDVELIKWLKDESAIRCVLMEVGVRVGGVETTRFLSNKGYVTSGSDTPSNTVYSPLIAGGIKFTERLSLDGSASLSFGDIELFNTSGDKDAWLNDVWTNRAVKLYIGDVSWARASFYKIFDGVVAGIDSRRRDRINLKLGDKLQRLNTPVSEDKLDGITSNKDRLIPLLFGECHNIEPLLVDPSVHEYQVHNGPIESFIEVRDNGVPVSYTPYVSTGKFRLNQQPVGTITCSAQGDKPSTYSNNVAVLVRRLATGFGNTTERLTLADVDTTSLDAFAAANTQPVGIYLNDRSNVLDACNKLASSVGARLTMTRTGLLYLVKVGLPVTSVTSVTSSDMVQHSLQVSGLPAVIAAVKLGYCKNWTVQSNLQTGIPGAHIALFAQDWLTTTVISTQAATDYKMNVEPVMQETYLLTEADAVTEANRRLDLFKTQRKVLQYSGLAHLMLEGLGKGQTITHSRFGLSGGVVGQIISLTSDWLNPHIDVEVLI